MTANSTLWMSFPNILSINRRIRFDSGMVVIAAAIPKDARVKNTIGSEYPVSAVPKSDVTHTTGIRPQNIRLVTTTGSASVTSMNRNAARIPTVLIPVLVRN